MLLSKREMGGTIWLRNWGGRKRSLCLRRNKSIVFRPRGGREEVNRSAKSWRVAEEMGRSPLLSNGVTGKKREKKKEQALKLPAGPPGVPGPCRKKSRAESRDWKSSYLPVYKRHETTAVNDRAGMLRKKRLR